MRLIRNELPTDLEKTKTRNCNPIYNPATKEALKYNAWQIPRKGWPLDFMAPDVILV